MRFYRLFRYRPDDGSVQFISQDSLERSSMSEMWDKVATEGKEQDVVGAMKILDESLNSIVFFFVFGTHYPVPALFHCGRYRPAFSRRICITLIH